MCSFVCNTCIVGLDGRMRFDRLISLRLSHVAAIVRDLLAVLVLLCMLHGSWFSSPFPVAQRLLALR
jgi:hypothetical protein